jgi:hypothetical protein
MQKMEERIAKEALVEETPKSSPVSFGFRFSRCLGSLRMLSRAIFFPQMLLKSLISPLA